MADLTEIREALAKATPRPWEHQECDDGCCHWIASPTIPEILKNGTLEDLDLIANAPAWLEALCDEVELLRREWKELADELEVVQSDRTEEWARAENAEAAVERVRAIPAQSPGGSFYMVSMEEVLAALDGE